jgi:hypothetical protein
LRFKAKVRFSLSSQKYLNSRDNPVPSFWVLDELLILLVSFDVLLPTRTMLVSFLPLTLRSLEILRSGSLITVP